MANESSSTGRIVWQTTMGMINNSVEPAISDSFQSNRWTDTQTSQGLIKYTQYIETGHEETQSPGGQAVTAISMNIEGVEKVDFGWLKYPKFVCFSNYTPEGTRGTSIFLGVFNETCNTSLYGESNPAIEKPLWFVGAKANNIDTEELWSSFASENAIGETTQEVATAWAETSYCQQCYEIPPKVTIGPLILPQGTTIWAYKAQNGAVPDDESNETSYGAILVTEAYDK